MTCEECATIVDRTDVPHCVRTCSRCGRVMHVHELGEHGIGLRIEKGDQFVIPAGWLKFSFDPTKSTGRFFASGLAWFAQLIFLEQFPQSSDVLPELERMLGVCDTALKESELLRGHDLEVQDQADTAVKLLEQNKQSAE